MVTCFLLRCSVLSDIERRNAQIQIGHLLIGLTDRTDQRVGQLIVNTVVNTTDPRNDGEQIFYITDEELASKLRRYSQQLDKPLRKSAWIRSLWKQWRKPRWYWLD